MIADAAVATRRADRDVVLGRAAASIDHTVAALVSVAVEAVDGQVVRDVHIEKLSALVMAIRDNGDDVACRRLRGVRLEWARATSTLTGLGAAVVNTFGSKLV